MTMTRTEYRTACKDAARKFQVGDTVEFDSRRQGQTLKGVITCIPRDPTTRWSVSCDGGQLAVPATMLRPSKLAVKAVAALANDAAAFDARRAANDSKVAERMKRIIARDGLVVGKKVLYHGRDTVITAIHETGKVQIMNPKYADRAEMLSIFEYLNREHGGAVRLDGSRLIAKKRLTVWANRLLSI